MGMVLRVWCRYPPPETILGEVIWPPLVVGGGRVDLPVSFERKVTNKV